MKRCISIIVVGAFLLTLACAKKETEVTQRIVEEKGYSDITAQELTEQIEQGKKFVLIDVRTLKEYAKGHIKGAILIPQIEIETRYKEISKKFT